MTLWIATVADPDGDVSWYQIVTRDPVDVIRFMTTYRDCHVAEWTDSDGEWEMVGP